MEREVPFVAGTSPRDEIDGRAGSRVTRTDPEESEEPTAVARRGGRPSREQAAQLQETILDAATELFLTEGFGATSIEAVAERARISKRTFYHRFDGKAKLFEAVVHRLIERWRPSIEARLLDAGSFDEMLRRTARQILEIALSPEALALHRIVIAESQRFPALARVMNDSGTKSGIDHIAALLEHEAKAGRFGTIDTRFAAEQFLTMVVAAPRRRALGFGETLSSDQLDIWAERTVDLFLHGCRSSRPNPADRGRSKAGP